MCVFVPCARYTNKLRKRTFIIFFCLPLMFFLLTPLDKIKSKVKSPLIEPPFVLYIYTWHEQVFATWINVHENDDPRGESGSGPHRTKPTEIRERVIWGSFCPKSASANQSRTFKSTMHAVCSCVCGSA